MKKIISLLLVLATFATAFGASFTETAIAKILAVSAKQFITPEFIAGVIKTREPNFYSDTCDFYAAYYMCRQRTYDTLFMDKTVNESSSGEFWRMYIKFRTVTVAKFKGELHSENALADVYAACRESFVKTVSGTEPAFRLNLLKMTKEAIAEFEAVKDKAERAVIMSDIARQDYAEYGDDGNVEVEKMLAKHVPATEIAQHVLDEPSFGTLKADVERKNLDMSKFALRRWNEGGDVLVEKYLTVLRMAKSDIISTLAVNR